MRFQLSQEQIDFYSSLPQEVKQHFVDASLAVPAHLLPPGIRRLTSLDDFDQALRETYDVVSVQPFDHRLLITYISASVCAGNRSPA